jgi:hypothetical protein
MNEDYDVEFGPVRISCSGQRIVVDGYAFRGTIVPGQRFTFLSESIVNRTSDGYGPSSRRPLGVIDLRVVSITMYGQTVDSLSCGVSARLELEGTGGDHIKPNTVLSGFAAK